MKFGLSIETIGKINSVFAKFPEIKKVIIYGSRAKGNYKKGSDIDLTLVGENINLSLTNKIEMQIDELLLPYTMDISIFHQIDNEELIKHINRVGNLFYSKTD
jgi:predicted nucleotidyltransferase